MFGLGSFFSKKRARSTPVDPWLRAYGKAIQARYDAAQTTPENERYWANSDGLAAQAATSATVRAKIRNRARYEAIESGSFARGMVHAKVNDVIGRGPSVQVRTKNREFNRACEVRWQEWCKRVNLASKLRQMAVAWYVDGESFAERFTNRKLPAGEVQLDIAVSEADLWSDPNPDDTDPNYVDGIQFDEDGNPVKYTRYRNHPGSSAADDRTITRDAEDVIHLFRPDRPGQRRGISHFATVLAPLAELRRYRLATIAAAEIAANYSAVMHSDANWFSEAPDELTEDFMRIDLERRAMLTLPAGWKISQLKAEQPTAGFDAFCDHYLSEIGRATLTPLNIVVGTSRQYNFASGRLDYLLYWNANDVDRSDVETVILERIWQWWIDEALLIAGYLPALNDEVTIPHFFQFPPRQPIDIEAQANADQVYFDLGFLTDHDYCQRVGKDLESYYDELEASIKERERIGAPLPGGQPKPEPGAPAGPKTANKAAKKVSKDNARKMAA